jgi:hypothetical protein
VSAALLVGREEGGWDNEWNEDKQKDIVGLNNYL